jgi:hypothetical protein
VPVQRVTPREHFDRPPLTGEALSGGEHPVPASPPCSVAGHEDQQPGSVVEKRAMR